MTASLFLNLDNRSTTELYKKIAEKTEKTKNKYNKIIHKHLSKEEVQKVLFLITLSSHYLEGFIDTIDELETLKVFSKDNELLRVRDRMLHAMNFFIKEAINKGEETELARMQQQKMIEDTIKKLNKMDLNKLHKVCLFIDGIAKPQKVYFQIKDTNPNICQEGMILFEEQDTIYFIHENKKIPKNEVVIIPDEFVYQKGDHFRVYKRFFQINKENNNHSK